MHPIPTATYRLQFNRQLNFAKAADLVDYLHELGISHLYASPLFKAKEGSAHGYDIADHGKLNPDLGTEADFQRLVEKLHHHGMGLILDIIPNHMCIVDAANGWWQDVLENGPSSPYADYFDIDWHPVRTLFHDKVLLPILEQPYGDALENQTFKLNYRQGRFELELPGMLLPTDPKSWSLLLVPLAQEVQKILSDKSPEYVELMSIITQVEHLPPISGQGKEKIEERLRENEVIKKRLDTLLNNSTLLNLLVAQLSAFNGQKGNPKSFDALESFLALQPYRLCFWRVANDEINYRRFFDIFEYAGIRVEKKEVFEAVHVLVGEFVKKGWVDGLRIDHIDGLWDPEQYLQDLQEWCKPPYLIAEKILLGSEKLRKEWPFQGSVGYDFLNQLNGLFVFQGNRKALHDCYHQFIGDSPRLSDLLYQSKMVVLSVSLPSELNMLARHLDRIAGHHRSSQDFTSESLKLALRDVIASFPVYRSYIQGSKIAEEDRQTILLAMARARRRSPGLSPSINQFIQSVLLLEHPDGLEESLKREREDFAMRFQQLTGPVMAKGLEDTAFYRHYPLASLNEVGGDLYSFGTSQDMFHKKNLERWEFWPHSMLATSTHDTKRSEDVRARINVISEMPVEWEKALMSWTSINDKHKVKDGDESIPDANEEYLFYQTLLGTWPLKPDEDWNIYLKRLQDYMEKAIKEAKVNSSWINPYRHYDLSVRQFIANALGDAEFLDNFGSFINRISSLGMLNSLSQTLLKLASPGVPDIFQGNEIWNFSLVDPDNRRPVDFDKSRKLLQSLDSLKNVLRSPEDGRIKLFLQWKMLRLRQKLPDIFSKGIYLPLYAEGPLQQHAIAFARILEKKAVIVIAGRFFSFYMKDFHNPLQQDPWRDTLIELPIELSHFYFHNVLTGDALKPNPFLDLHELMQPLPVALLEGELLE